MSSQHDAISVSLQELNQAGERAITTVMGPATADLNALLTTDPTLLTELAEAAQKATADGLEQSDLADKLMSVQRALIGDKAQQFQQKLQQTKQQLTAVNGASGAAAERLLKAEAKFSHSLKFICNQVQKINKAETKIKKLNNQLTDILDSTDDDTSDNSTSDVENKKKKLIEKKKKAKLEAEYKETLQKKRDQYVTQKKLCEQQIFEHFDDTLGGMQATVKCSKNELDLPKQLEKATMRTITDAFKTYFLHRANEYWAILPYVYYILSSYNPKTGLFYQPPSKGTDYANVPETIRPMFRTQAELFYRVILTCIKQSGMATITQQFLCGIHKDIPASCPVDDGPMAMYCLMAKYAKVDDQHLISLEQEFINAPHHFMSGSPAMKVKHLVPYLEEVLELGVKLKASQTIIPIVDILTQRENKFAVELAKYADGGNSPDDCAATIEQLFSDITRTCNRLENAAGSQDIWYAKQHQVHLADVQAPGKGKGKSKGKGKGKGKSWQYPHHAYYAYNATQHNNTAQPESGKCWAQGCTAQGYTNSDSA